MLVKVAAGGTLAVASLATTVSGYFILSQPLLERTRLDPIINPGTVSQHVHAIVGASNFQPTMDFAKSEASRCTTAPVSVDKSSYWTPQLYSLSNGVYTLIPGSGANVYYLPRTDAPPQAFPAGHRMVSGNPYRRTFNASSFDDQAVSFVCLTSESHSGKSLVQVCGTSEVNLRRQVLQAIPVTTSETRSSTCHATNYACRSISRPAVTGVSTVPITKTIWLGPAMASVAGNVRTLIRFHSSKSSTSSFTQLDSTPSFPAQSTTSSQTETPRATVSMVTLLLGGRSSTVPTCCKRLSTTAIKTMVSAVCSTVGALPLRRRHASLIAFPSRMPTFRPVPRLGFCKRLYRRERPRQ